MGTKNTYTQDSNYALLEHQETKRHREQEISLKGTKPRAGPRKEHKFRSVLKSTLGPRGSHSPSPRTLQLPGTELAPHRDPALGSQHPGDASPWRVFSSIPTRREEQGRVCQLPWREQLPGKGRQEWLGRYQRGEASLFTTYRPPTLSKGAVQLQG